MRIFEVRVNNQKVATFDDLELAKDWITSDKKDAVENCETSQILRYEIFEHVIIEREAKVFADYLEVVINEE